MLDSQTPNHTRHFEYSFLVEVALSTNHAHPRIMIDSNYLLSIVATRIALHLTFHFDCL